MLLQWQSHPQTHPSWHLSLVIYGRWFHNCDTEESSAQQPLSSVAPDLASAAQGVQTCRKPRAASFSPAWPGNTQIKITFQDRLWMKHTVNEKGLKCVKTQPSCFLRSFLHNPIKQQEETAFPYKLPSPYKQEDTEALCRRRLYSSHKIAPANKW